MLYQNAWMWSISRGQPNGTVVGTSSRRRCISGRVPSDHIIIQKNCNKSNYVSSAPIECFVRNAENLRDRIHCHVLNRINIDMLAILQNGNTQSVRPI